MRRVLEVPAHPFMAAAFPVLALLAANLGQVRISVAVRPLLIVLAGTALMGLVLRVLVRDWKRLSMLLTWFVVLFFSYGHVYNALRELEVAGTTLGRHRYLVPAWLLLGAAGVWLLGSRSKSTGWIAGLNTVLGLAVILPVAQIAGDQIAFERAAGSLGGATRLQLIEAIEAETQQMPDVYHIVLDAYGRSDTLAESFEFDNAEFLASLRDIGFYVADCSLSNYAQSELSLASTLNFSYLEDLIDIPTNDQDGREQLWPLIRNSAVRRVFEDLGYTTIAFETGYYWSEWEDADLYLAPRSGLFGGMTAFEGTLLRSTAAWALIDALPVLPGGLVRDLDRSADAHRQRLQYVLDELMMLPRQVGPKFVFAHIVSPHRPFVFDAEGNPVDDDYRWTQSSIGLASYAQGYRGQLTYLNQRLLDLLGRLIAESDPAPIILLHSDHGPEEGSSLDRMRILNAYFGPASDLNGLYAATSPVNSFRWVLGTIFGAPIELLPDLSYFSVYDRPFSFQSVDDDCASLDRR